MAVILSVIALLLTLADTYIVFFFSVKMDLS